MKDLQITQELKGNIEKNQNLLKNAIRNHQDLVVKLKEDSDNLDIQKQINKAEQEIVLIGITQKSLLDRLREEYKLHQNSLKANIVKNSIEERRFNLSTALSRARKQNIICRVSARPATFSISSSVSDDSVEGASIHSSPEQQIFHPLEPHDISQTEFLNQFGLVTHDVYKEMQNRRVERKRRSTANPHFLYGNKGWDFQPPKRRRNAYLYSSVSPPNTRQAVKKRNERTSPLLNSNANHNVANGNNAQKSFPSLPSLPNLPSGLTIERVSPSRGSPDAKSCVACKQSGSLMVCESCANGFHVSCHNRPLAQAPRLCPRCIRKELRTVGSLNVPSGMSVSCLNSAEVSEKIEEKKTLENTHKNLSAELTQLQDRHSQLTISLRTQKSHKEELLMTQQSTEEKIQQILSFIGTIKSAQMLSSPEASDNESKAKEESFLPTLSTPPSSDEVEIDEAVESNTKDSTQSPDDE